MLQRAPLRSVALWAPPPGTPGKFETIVLLHGMQAAPPDPNWMVTLHYQKAFQNRILIAPALPKLGSDWSASANTAAVAAVVKEIAAQYPVDPAAVYVIGYSAGGGRVLNVASRLPMKAAGIASVAGDLLRPWRLASTRPKVSLAKVLLLCMTEDDGPHTSCALNERNRKQLESRGVTHVSLRRLAGDHQLNFDHVAGALDEWIAARP